MLHRYGEVFRSFLTVADMLLVAACWTAAYALRFTVFWDEPPGVWKPGFTEWMTPVVGIVPLVFWLFRTRGLYRLQRTGSLLREAGIIVGGMSMAVIGRARRRRRAAHLPQPPRHRLLLGPRRR